MEKQTRRVWETQPVSLTLEGLTLLASPTLPAYNHFIHIRDTAMPISRNALDTYYASLRNYQQRGVTHEQATRLTNRADDPEYIARLVGRVVTVSVGTVKAVRELTIRRQNE